MWTNPYHMYTYLPCQSIHIQDFFFSGSTACRFWKALNFKVESKLVKLSQWEGRLICAFVFNLAFFEDLFSPWPFVDLHTYTHFVSLALLDSFDFSLSPPMHEHCWYVLRVKLFFLLFFREQRYVNTIILLL